MAAGRGAFDLFIFDWSGVISDDTMPVYSVNMRFLEEHGKPTMPFERWKEESTQTIIGFVGSYGIHGGERELYERYTRYFKEAVASGLVPTVYPDVHETFRYLKDRRKKLAVLSSHPVESLSKEAEKYGVVGFFDVISGGHIEKPEGIEGVCRKIGEEKGRSLYIGDTVYDIRAARKAGVPSAGICTGYHSRKRLEAENPDIILSCLSDLKRVA